MKKFYVYVLLDPMRPGKYMFILSDGTKLFFEFEPFYVGKGTGNRMHQHVSSVKKGIKDKNKHKVNRIKKILEADLVPIEKALKKNLDEVAAFDLEKECINLIGRRDLKLGTLVNWTDGGEGLANPSKITRQRKSRTQKKIRAGESLADSIVRDSKIKEGVFAYWNSLSDEQKKVWSDRVKKKFAEMSIDEKKLRTEKGRAAYLKILEDMPDFLRKELLGSGSKKWWAELKENKTSYKNFNKKTGEALRQSLKKRPLDKKINHQENLAEAQIRRLQMMTPQQRWEESQRKAEASNRFIKNLSEKEWKQQCKSAKEGQRAKYIQCPHCPVFHFEWVVRKHHFDRCKYAEPVEFGRWPSYDEWLTIPDGQEIRTSEELLKRGPVQL